MENTYMATKVIEKVRTGPKAKAPEDKHKAIAFYAPQRDIDDFGGMEFAREFVDNMFQKHLAKIKSGKVKKGTYNETP